jgi:PAS domain S-box-containing protein
VFRSAIERANLRLIVDCPPLPEAVYVDREMWEKIVLNLLSNAFKFTFEGEIAIGLQWANDRVDLIVRDTGIGIPAAELPHLFERFHRVKGVQGRSIEGSGIGLSLVQELVKLHQGTINVTSTEGAGTCFTLSIPTGTAHLLPDRIGAPRTLASTALGANSYLEEALRWLPEEANREWQRANGGNILPTPTPDSRLPTSPTPRILLADDNADMRDYVRRLLSQQYEVKAVADGSEALSAIRRQVPDLILTDVMMPNLDGFGLLQALRSDPETREVPIIMLSARAGEEARIEGLAAGADDYLTKPFSARELLARVEATLKLAQLRQEVGAALRESEAKYRLLFESIDQGFCIIEMVFNAANQPIDYRFLLTNPAFDKQTGTENAMGKTVREIAPQHEDYWFEIYGNVALTGESIRFENLAQEFHRWYEVYAFPIGEPEQRRVGILFNDITDRKRVEEARAATEQRYRIVSDLIPFGMWEADMQGSATYLSQLFLEMTGQTLEEHRQTWHTLLHPDDRQPTVAACMNACKAAVCGSMSSAYAAKTDTIAPFLLAGYPCATRQAKLHPTSVQTMTSPIVNKLRKHYVAAKSGCASVRSFPWMPLLFSIVCGMKPGRSSILSGRMSIPKRLKFSSIRWKNWSVNGCWMCSQVINSIANCLTAMCAL